MLPRRFPPHRFMSGCKTLFRRSPPQKTGHDFRLSSHGRSWCTNFYLYIVASSHQLDISCLLSCIHCLRAFSFCSFQPIRIRCWLAADTFLFLTWASLVILQTSCHSASSEQASAINIGKTVSEILIIRRLLIIMIMIITLTRISK